MKNIEEINNANIKKILAKKKIHSPYIPPLQCSANGTSHPILRGISHPIMGWDGMGQEFKKSRGMGWDRIFEKFHPIVGQNGKKWSKKSFFYSPWHLIILILLFIT